MSITLAILTDFTIQEPKWCKVEPLDQSGHLREEVADYAEEPNAPDASPLDGVTDKTSVKQRQELRWPEVTRLTYNDDGKIKLNAQQHHVQSILRTSISEMQKYLAFENAYPTILQRQQVTGDLLHTAATENRKGSDICERLQDDAKYVCALATVVCTPAMLVTEDSD